MGLPKISVITPSLNQGKYLRQTLESVLSQNYPELEYIVVDGGSTDESVSILEQYRDRIDHLIIEPDQGQADAINKGFRLASGDIIGWINSDDLLEQHALERIGMKYSESEDKIVLGDVRFFSEDTGEERVMHQRNVTFENLVQIWNGSLCDWVQPGTWVPRSALENVGYLDTKMHLAFDLEWMCRLMQKYEVVYIDGITAKFRIHHEAKSQNFMERWFDELCSVTGKFTPHLNASIDLNHAKSEIQISWIALRFLDPMLGTTNRLEALRHYFRAFCRSPAILMSRRFYWGLLLMCLPDLVKTKLLRFYRRMRTKFF